MDIEKELVSLLDREAIRDLITGRYCSAADWLDIEDLKDCFTQDSQASFGDKSISGEEFCDLWAKLGSGFQMRFHFVAAERIFVDGDNARAEARTIQASTFPDPTKDDDSLRDHLEGSRYFIDLVRESDGAWRISKMHIAFDWSMMQPHQGTTVQGFPFDKGLDTSNSFYSHMMGKDRV